jgi:hypothetical protein
MKEVDSFRPSGIKRKTIVSPTHVITTAGDYPIAMLPHGGRLLGVWFVPTVALTVADEVVDIGIAVDGDTVIDGFTVPYASSVVGTAVDIFQTKGTNGGLIQIAPLTTLWAQSSGASTAGTGFFVIEYEDNNN